LYPNQSQKLKDKLAPEKLVIGIMFIQKYPIINYSICSNVYCIVNLTILKRD